MSLFNAAFFKMERFYELLSRICEAANGLRPLLDVVTASYTTIVDRIATVTTMRREEAAPTASIATSGLMLI